MKTIYNNAFFGMAALLGISLVSCAQNPNVKTKTITIINGDTTISEGKIDDKDIDKMMKDINVTINSDGDSTHKIVKKIIISGDDAEDAKAMAYAYGVNDGDDQDIEVTTDGNGSQTKIIIKKGDKSDKRSEEHTSEL